MRLSLLSCILSILTGSASAQIITTFAGCGTSCPYAIGIPATASRLIGPNSGVFDKKGNFYFTQNHTVCRIDTGGIINIIAGTTTPGYNGDGIAATAAKLNFPSDVKIDSIGNIFICDHQNCRIRRIDIATGLIATIAGDGSPGYFGDGGPATSAKFNYPGYICFDHNGNLFISDPNNRRLRKVNNAGIVTTFAGNGSSGYSGDGGPATAAEITPGTICFDSSGNIYIGDYSMGQTRIAKINCSTSIISTFAGTDTGGTYNGDGIQATAANIAPASIAFDKMGNMFVADGANNRIRKIDTTGIIHTIAGTGISGYSGDLGLATAAELSQPENVVFDTCGNLFITEVINARVRKITFNPTCTLESLSASDIKKKEEIKIYPNPAYKILVIENGCREAVITNMLGQMMLQKEIDSAKETLNIERLPAGVYVVKVRDDEGRVMISKFVKE